MSRNKTSNHVQFNGLRRLDNLRRRVNGARRPTSPCNLIDRARMQTPGLATRRLHGSPCKGTGRKEQRSMSVSNTQSRSQSRISGATRVYSPSKESENEADTGGEWCPICTENPAPCVPEGGYEAVCTKATKYSNPRFKRDEIALTFKLSDGPYAGIELRRFYSAKTAGRRRSNYYREWIIANGGAAPSARQQMPYRKFKGKLFKIRVGTVLTDASQEKLPTSVQYSKVAAILELVLTNEDIN